MATRKDIQEALELLDASDDQHWTEDGMPRVDVVSSLVGKSVSREEITSIAPKFTRNKPILGADDTDDTPKVIEPVAPLAVSRDDYNAQIAAKSDEITVANATLNEHKRRLQLLEAERDAMIIKRDKLHKPICHADAIKAMVAATKSAQNKTPMDAALGIRRPAIRPQIPMLQPAGA